MKRPMIALLQRVSSAKVEVGGRTTASIGRGLLVFLCVVRGDTDEDLDHLADKIARLRVFEDKDGKMNLSVQDVHGELLVVSQFTLAASTRKGIRPSFDSAEAPDRARAMYERLVERLRSLDLTVRTGEFAATMAVTLTNDGPVTILVDSRRS
jgi:D-tyrosyl-tRNA(Tyr) deacylase